MKQTRKSRGAGQRIARALRDLLDEARASGCKDPALFFEAESSAVFVLDRNHPAYNATKGAMPMQQSAILRAEIQCPFDTGAW